MLNVSASSSTRHRYDIKLYNCSVSLPFHPGLQSCTAKEHLQQTFLWTGMGSRLPPALGHDVLTGQQSRLCHPARRSCATGAAKRAFHFQTGPRRPLVRGARWNKPGECRTRRHDPRLKTSQAPGLLDVIALHERSGWPVPSNQGISPMPPRWGNGKLGFFSPPSSPPFPSPNSFSAS